MQVAINERQERSTKIQGLAFQLTLITIQQEKQGAGWAQRDRHVPVPTRLKHLDQCTEVVCVGLRLHVHQDGCLVWPNWKMSGAQQMVGAVL